MNKKEILGLCEFLKLHGFENTDNISKFIFGLQQENKQLKIQISAREEEYNKLEDNWNYIKKMLKEARQEKFNVIGYCGTCTDVDIDFLLDKMQEMEKNYGNVEDNT